MNKKLKICAAFLLMAVCSAVSLVKISPAYADMTITPTRVVFEDRDRFSEVTLINTSDKKKSYEVGWRFFKMVEDRMAYEEVEGSLTEFDVSKYIVFTPRRVTLAPGGKQKIRLALRRPAEVPAGEYRAHLEFRGLPDVEPPKEMEPGKASAMVKINVGYSIPVVFRAGEPDDGAVIENVSFKRNEQNGRLHALVKIVRTGAYGALGHLYIYNDKDEVIGEIGNAHIFPEVGTRIFDVPLIDENLSGSNIRVALKHYDQISGSRVYDEKTIPIQ